MHQVAKHYQDFGWWQSKHVQKLCAMCMYTGRWVVMGSYLYFVNLTWNLSH